MLRRKLILKNIGKIVAHATMVFCASTSTSCIIDDVFDQDGIEENKRSTSFSNP
jgi:hypothetical protein